MDNQTRQFGVPEEPPQRPRPKQYFPDPAEQERPRYQEPPRYEQPRYEQPQYTQPAPPEPEPRYYEEPEERSNTLAMVLGVLLAIALAAGVVFFLLWRGASAEASKPPVTVTNTQTETVTSTETTTKRPSLFGDRDRDSHVPEPTALTESELSELPEAPDVQVPDEVRTGAEDLLDELRRGADDILQNQ